MDHDKAASTSVQANRLPSHTGRDLDMTRRTTGVGTHLFTQPHIPPAACSQRSDERQGVLPMIHCVTGGITAVRVPCVAPNSVYSPRCWQGQEVEGIGIPRTDTIQQPRQLLFQYVPGPCPWSEEVKNVDAGFHRKACEQAEAVDGKSMIQREVCTRGRM